MEKIIFEEIKNKDIFGEDYQNFVKNNEIDFSKDQIAVLYGPNGTGKTSLVKVLSSEAGTNVKYTYLIPIYTSQHQF